MRFGAEASLALAMVAVWLALQLWRPVAVRRFTRWRLKRFLRRCRRGA